MKTCSSRFYVPTFCPCAMFCLILVVTVCKNLVRIFHSATEVCLCTYKLEIIASRFASIYISIMANKTLLAWFNRSVQGVVDK